MKTFSLPIIFMLLACLLSCSKQSNFISKNSDNSSEILFTDDLKRTVTLASSPKKVAVLQGSLAHIWLCAGGEIKAATKDAFSEPEAITAEEAEKLNTEWKTSTFTSSEAGLIRNDDVVNLGAMMKPNKELLISGDYDFVIMSANISGHKALEELLTSMNIPCAYFRIETFADYMNMMEICSKITGDSDSYKKNALDVAANIKNIVESVSSKEKQKQPKILLLRAHSSGESTRSSRNDMTGSMLKDLGCINIADSDDYNLDDLSIEKIIAENPDFIFVTTMGSNHNKAVESLRKKLESNPAWETLDAIKNKRLIILPRSLFHYKPCEKWDSCYEILATILYE
ncbi:MAG: ABC transporter substrate-binding protein [Treponema sp.]|nr:ABC transporter substrate-binding protein [Treponema sp.]